MAAGEQDVLVVLGRHVLQVLRESHLLWPLEVQCFLIMCSSPTHGMTCYRCLPVRVLLLAMHPLALRHQGGTVFAEISTDTVPAQKITDRQKLFGQLIW